MALALKIQTNRFPPQGFSPCLCASAATLSLGFPRHSPLVTRHCLIQSQQVRIKMLRKLLKTKDRNCNQSQLILTHSTLSIPSLPIVAGHSACGEYAVEFLFTAQFQAPNPPHIRKNHRSRSPARVTGFKSRVAAPWSRVTACSFVRRCGSQTAPGCLQATTHQIPLTNHGFFQASQVAISSAYIKMVSRILHSEAA